MFVNPRKCANKNNNKKGKTFNFSPYYKHQLFYIKTALLTTEHNGKLFLLLFCKRAFGG